jgi:small subunit ribosomal protein S6
MAETKKYELVIISRFNPKTKKGELDLEKIKSVIDKSGKILQENNWGKKTLAYPIKKETSGYYYLLTFKINPGRASQLDNILKLNENIIRYLLIAIT